MIRSVRLLPWVLVSVGGAVALPPAAPGQKPAAAAGSPAQDPPRLAAPAAPERDLTTRFRFRERYAARPQPGFLSLYDVAFREVLRITTENAQAAPTTEEIVRSGRFTEMPVQVADVDRQSIATLMRRYGAAEVSPDPFSNLGPPQLMEDMTLWITDPASVRPQILSLTPGRMLREQEYRFVQSNPFLPSMALLLPGSGVRLGETWNLSRPAAAALLGEPVSGGSLVARLVEIVPEPPAEGGTASEAARIDIEGTVQTAGGPTQVRARCTFLFKIQAQAPAAPARPTAGPAIVEAEGGLTKVRLAALTTVPAVPDGPPGGERRRELILERRLTSNEPPLPRPQAEPDRTPENSWLLFSDPKGRFYFLHPQDFRNDVASANQLTLVRERGKTPDLIALGFLEGDPPKPEVAFQPMLDRYRDAGFEVRIGASKRLPAEAWGNREAYRVEAVLDPPVPKEGSPAAPKGQRIHIDGYVVLFGTKAALTATVYTTREDVDTLRLEVEKILQQFKLGKPGARGG